MSKQDNLKLRLFFLVIAVIALGLYLYTKSYSGNQNGTANIPAHTSKDDTAPFAHLSQSTPLPSNSTQTENKTTKPELPVVVEAKRKITEVTRLMEKANSKLLYHDKLSNSEVSIVSLSAPSLDQISDVSTKMTQIIAESDPAQQDAVRKALQQLYDDAFNYPAAYKVVYLMLYDFSDKPILTVSDMDDISNVAPNANGDVAITGKRTQVNDVGWKERFGHIFDIPSH